jgi:hypothetical protein
VASNSTVLVRSSLTAIVRFADASWARFRKQVRRAYPIALAHVRGQSSVGLQGAPASGKLQACQGAKCACTRPVLHGTTCFARGLPHKRLMNGPRLFLRTST